ncbi:MAG: bifunctional phosphoglucose/phosphomannose isomerase [Patescibacteria group bacterium]
MKKLENKNIFQKYDSGKVLSSLEQLPKQCRQAQKETKNLKFPAEYRRVRNILVCGMGGSGLGSDLIRNVFASRLRVPLNINADYDLPDYVDKDSLVVASSYSGNTEETLVACRAALKRGSKLLVISAGGKLAGFARHRRLPAYIFTPNFNPSGQPRLGLGYSVISQTEIFRKLNILRISEKEIESAIGFLESSINDFSIAARNNPAKQIAYRFFRKVPVIFSGNSLLGSAHVLANQINENAKNYVSFYALPELNHHLLEGLTHPTVLRQFTFLLLESNLDSPAVKKRFSVTRKILAKKKLEATTLVAKGRDRFSQALWLMLFGGFASFYLAMLNQENPSLIPWVDFLKRELAKK